MTAVALAGLLLTAGCGTSSGLVSQALPGGPGQPIFVEAGLEDTGVITDREGSRQHSVQVVVSNVENFPVTVTKIVVMTEGNGALQGQSVSRTYNEMIDPGKEHQFDLLVTVRLVRPFSPGEPRVLSLRVLVTLSNGDTYYYTFEAPVHELTTP